jgi:hypothetical protein
MVNWCMGRCISVVTNDDDKPGIIHGVYIDIFFFFIRIAIFVAQTARHRHKL